MASLSSVASATAAAPPLVDTHTKPAQHGVRGAWSQIATPSRWWLRLAGRMLPEALAAAGALLLLANLSTSLSMAEAILLGALWLSLLLASGAFDPMGEPDSVRPVTRASVSLAITCWLTSTLTDVGIGSELLLAFTAAVSAAAVGRRLTIRTWLALSGPPAKRRRPVTLAGEVDDVRRVLSELARGPRPRWEVRAICLPEEAITCHEDPDSVFGAPVWVGLDRLADATRVSGSEAAILIPSGRLQPEALRRLTWQLHSIGAAVYVGTGLLGVTAARTTMVRAGDLGMVHLRAAPSTGPARLAKELVERVLAALALLLLAPLLTVIALAVCRGSAGGPLFRQVRVGRDGRPFTMYKFRTMTVDAESRMLTLVTDNEADQDGVLFKMRSDPRVTRIGALLRRYSLDEVPQLVNVLRGNMSLVGPRPALPHEVARYDVDPRRRLAVKPGLTGLWQVSGRSDLSWEDTVRLDLHYVDNWSLWLDASIVCRTVRAVLGHRGAY